jgi:hypothetical protein
MILEHPDVTNVSFHLTGHARYVLLLVLSTHPVKIEKKTHHKISSQHRTSCIQNIILGCCTGDALILVKDIIY